MCRKISNFEKFDIYDLKERERERETSHSLLNNLLIREIFIPFTNDKRKIFRGVENYLPLLVARL